MHHPFRHFFLCAAAKIFELLAGTAAHIIRYGEFGQFGGLQGGAAVGDGSDHATVVIEEQGMLCTDRLCLRDEDLLLIGEGFRQGGAWRGVGSGVAFGTGTSARENRQNYHYRKLK